MKSRKLHKQGRGWDNITHCVIRGKKGSLFHTIYASRTTRAYPVSITQQRNEMKYRPMDRIGHWNPGVFLT